MRLKPEGVVAEGVAIRISLLVVGVVLCVVAIEGLQTPIKRRRVNQLLSREAFFFVLTLIPGPHSSESKYFK